MPNRPMKTAEEIQAEVRRQVHDGELVKADGATIKIPVPTPLADGVREANGSNWTMSVFGGAAGYEAWVLHCVYNVQALWDLRK